MRPRSISSALPGRARRVPLAVGLVLAATPLLVAFSSDAGAAAPGWSTPRAVSHGASWVYAVRSDGTGVQATSLGGRPVARTVSARAVLNAPVPIAADPLGQATGEVASLADGGDVGFAWRTVSLSGPGGPGGDQGVVAAVGERKALPRTSVTLTRSGAVTTLGVCTRDDGSTVVAWAELATGSQARALLKVAVLRPGQPAVLRTLGTAPAPASEGQAHVLFDTSGRTIVAWLLPTEATSATLAWADGVAGRASEFGEPVQASIPYGDGFAPDTRRGSEHAPVKLGAFADGRLVAVWTVTRKDCRSTGEDQICEFGKDPAVYEAETTSARSPLGAPRRLMALPGQTAPGPADMSVNTDGRAIVALAAGGHLITQSRSQRGAWGEKRTLGKPNREVSTPAVAVDRSQRSLIVWADASSRPDDRGQLSYRFLSAASGSGQPPTSYNQVAQPTSAPACHLSDVALVSAPSGRAYGLWCAGNRLAPYSPPAR